MYIWVTTRPIMPSGFSIFYHPILKYIPHTL